MGEIKTGRLLIVRAAFLSATVEVGTAAALCEPRGFALASGAQCSSPPAACEGNGVWCEGKP